MTKDSRRCVYEDSKFSEDILGGITRNTLESPTMPFLRPQ